MQARLDFEDKSYVCFEHSEDHRNIIISIGAKSSKNLLETIVNSVEIPREKFYEVVDSLKENV